MAETTASTEQTLSPPSQSSPGGLNVVRAFLTQWLGTASFSRDAIASFALHIFSAAVGLVTTLILARLIGAANYGIYAVSIVYANVFAYVACLGFPQLIVRTQARATATNNSTVDISKVRSTAMITAATLGVALAFLGLVFSTWILPSSTAATGWAFVIAMLMVVPVAYQRLGEATLLGRHQPILSLLPERLIRPICMLVAVSILALVAGTGLGAQSGIGAQAIAYVMAIAGTIYLVSRTATQPRASPFTADPKLLKDALPFFFVGLTTLLAGRVDIMMLAALTDAATVGQYRLAAQVAAIVMMVTIVSQAVLSPKISKLSHENELSSLTRRLPQLGLVLLFLTAAFACFVYVGFQIALPWIGADFAKASSVLAVLLTAFTLVAALSAALPLLTMTGHAKSAAVANVFAIALNVTLNLIFIPQLGGIGAALSTAISLTALYMIYTIIACRLICKS